MDAGDARVYRWLDIVPAGWSVPESVLDFCGGKLNQGLTDAEKGAMFKFLIRLLNSSPKAHRLAAMFDRGEISGDTLLELIG